jgi:hypothetical protein
MPTIQRLRYFDGEFLAGADLELEQRYHIEMRRKLNRQLHLYGVIEGLSIAAEPDAAAMGLDIVAINKGFAIDHFGREIAVVQSRAIDDTVLALNKITLPGTYDVWLCYQETAMTPPSISKQNCNGSAADQFTRWTESYSMVLLDENTPLASEPENQPRSGMGGVRLGSITIAVDPMTMRLRVTTPVPIGPRQFAGLRAQTFVHPQNEPPVINILAADEPPSPLSWMTVQSEIAMRRNQLVGNGFAVAPAPAGVPETGNLKVSGCFFLQGKQYLPDTGGQWIDLDEYIKARMPYIVAGSEEVTVPDDTTDDEATFDIPGSAGLVAKPREVIVALTAVRFRDKAFWKTWLSKIPASQDVEITLGAVEFVGTGPYQGKFKWTIKPNTNDPTPLSMVRSFSYSYVAIFRP